MNKQFDIYYLLENLEFIKKYKNKYYKDTKKYQKIYDFELDKGKNDTWNNEADAFKHAYMQAHARYFYGKQISDFIGWLHERNGNKYNNQIYQEYNMDLWNNAIGQEIGQRAEKELKNISKNLSQKEIECWLAYKVMEKMKKGELITNPFEDKRSYKNLKKYSSQDFGLNVDHKRIITREELAQMPLDKYSEQEEFIYELLNLGNIMSQREAEQRFNSGELIWVDDYFRDDGTHVSGYFRRI